MRVIKLQHNLNLLSKRIPTSSVSFNRFVTNPRAHRSNVLVQEIISIYYYYYYYYYHYYYRCHAFTSQLPTSCVLYYYLFSLSIQLSTDFEAVDINMRKDIRRPASSPTPFSIYLSIFLSLSLSLSLSSFRYFLFCYFFIFSYLFHLFFFLH